MQRGDAGVVRAGRWGDRVWGSARRVRTGAERDKEVKSEQGVTRVRTWGPGEETGRGSPSGGFGAFAVLVCTPQTFKLSKTERAGVTTYCPLLHGPTSHVSVPLAQPWDSLPRGRSASCAARPSSSRTKAWITSPPHLPPHQHPTMPAHCVPSKRHSLPNDQLNC